MENSPEPSVIDKLKSWRGILAVVSILVAWIGSIVAWANATHLGSTYNFWLVVLAFIPITHLTAYLRGGNTLFIYSFGSLFYALPHLIATNVFTGDAAAVSAGVGLSAIGCFVSFINYPGLSTDNVVSLRELTTVIPAGGVLLSYIIGFISLATISHGNIYAVTAVVQLTLTAALFFTAVAFNLKYELYIALIAEAHLVASSLLPALSFPGGDAATGVARAGAVFAWFATLGMLIVTILRLDSIKQEGAAADVDRVKDKVATWRGIAVLAANLVAFIGAICMWASQPASNTSYLAAIAFASCLVACLGYLLAKPTLYALAFGWLVVSFGPMIDSARISESGAAGIAGAIFLVIGMFVSYCTYPKFEFNNELSRPGQIGSLIGALFTFIGAICLSAGHQNLVTDFIYGNLPARASATCLYFIFAMFMQTPDFYGAAFLIGMLYPMSMYGLLSNSPTGTASAVFLFFAALIMAVFYHMRVLASGLGSGTEKEYKPIMGQDPGAGYPPASEYPPSVGTTSYPPVGVPTTDNGPFGQPPPSASDFAPHPDEVNA